MSRYLITGGLGFIGTALADTLLSHGHQVRIIDNLSAGRPNGVSPDRELLIGDVADRVLVAEAMDGVDGCFHLATSSRATCGIDDIACNNLPGMINVLLAAKSAGGSPVPVVYASSAITYGDNAHTSLREQVTARPLTTAAADKTNIEMRARVASLAHGVPTTGLRLFSVYGPVTAPVTPDSGVVASFIECILGGRPVTIHGDGQQTRDFVYLPDAVKFFTAAMSMPARQPAIYNVCTGRATRVDQLAQTLFSLLGRPAEILYGSARKGDLRSSVGNPDHAIRHLGLRAGTTLAEGLQQTISTRSDSMEGDGARTGSAGRPRSQAVAVSVG